jgi:hypothetical protein
MLGHAMGSHTFCSLISLIKVAIKWIICNVYCESAQVHDTQSHQETAQRNFIAMRHCNCATNYCGASRLSLAARRRMMSSMESPPLLGCGILPSASPNVTDPDVGATALTMGLPPDIVHFSTSFIVLVVTAPTVDLPPDDVPFTTRLFFLLPMGDRADYPCFQRPWIIYTCGHEFFFSVSICGWNLVTSQHE